MVSEIALATVLLIAAGLLIRSFSRLLAVSTGFQPERVLSLQLFLPQARYSPSARVTFMKLSWSMPTRCRESSARARSLAYR